MPSAKPRLNLTLPTDLSELIDRAAVVREVSRPQVVLELLEAVKEPLQGMVETMEVVRAAPKNLQQTFAAALQTAMQDLEPHVAGVVDVSEVLTSKIEKAVQQAVEEAKRDIASTAS